LTLGATCKAVRMIVRETRLVALCFTGPVVPSAVLYEAMRRGNEPYKALGQKIREPARAGAGTVRRWRTCQH
jgi:hypothetical protein